jgi:hypothetical protein
MPNLHISADTSTKIGNALAPAFRAVRPVVNFARQTKAALAPINPETNTDLKAKQSNIEEYQRGVASEKGIKSYKKGGKVKKTAIYRLHKGERVLNPKQTKKMDKMGGMASMLAGDTDKDGK